MLRNLYYYPYNQFVINLIHQCHHTKCDTIFYICMSAMSVCWHQVSVVRLAAILGWWWRQQQHHSNTSVQITTKHSHQDMASQPQITLTLCI